MLTVLLTSPRVAPGLLTWQAWSALRSASRVLAASAAHPQVAALTAAGVVVDVLDVSVSVSVSVSGVAGAVDAVDAPSEAGSLAGVLSAAVADADGPVVWLAPPGEHADSGLLSALPVPSVVLHGSHDLPGAHLLDVVSVMDRLRTSCPWDREQTHDSLTPYLLEEAYEAVETVESGDLTALREELGDVLLQVAFHARIAAERPPDEGGYTIDDVADTLVAKLIRRHPHVFGSVSASSAGDVAVNWEEIKKAERAQRSAALGAGAPSVLDGVPFGQSALSLAAQLQRRAERAGFAESALFAGPSAARSSGSQATPSALTSSGSSASPSAGDELGDELMRVVARARSAGIDPEMQLRETARRFAERVRHWERSSPA